VNDSRKIFFSQKQHEKKEDNDTHFNSNDYHECRCRYTTSQQIRTKKTGTVADNSPQLLLSTTHPNEDTVSANDDEFWVRYVSYEEGRTQIVDTTRTICQAIQKNRDNPSGELESFPSRRRENKIEKTGCFNGKYHQLQGHADEEDEEDEEINDDLINSNMQILARGPDGKTVALPDCDYLLKFDSSLAMVPYLPWSIRLTEILQLGTIDKFECGSFLKALAIYGQIEQRFGV